MALTGRQIAIEMTQKFQGRDWIAALAEQCGQTRDFVEWHLKEDMTPPIELGEAASAMLERADDDFAGLPANTRKLRQG
ncbi:hypothetical protein DWF00_16645 [Bosea caraganae]|uniref:Uncharacterized protein n=1 Tax=Bosea caraganae TaxID=2763117 RepID=A0A370KYS5_9HYPH|nr:hypothetical protein [Bosea caraganae]RDJ20138.1 hypothetical protein DWE98_26250 [Bosea caraganae]RDJ24850.1 hypothetical protein DWF00_16645 [Bosea caraganae]